MSHIRVKTKYNTEGYYGSTEQHTIYANHNNCSDYVTYYDEDGTVIMVVPDTMDNNILDAINRLYVPNLENGNLKDGLEHYQEEEISILQEKLKEKQKTFSKQEVIELLEKQKEMVAIVFSLYSSTFSYPNDYEMVKEKILETSLVIEK